MPRPTSFLAALALLACAPAEAPAEEPAKPPADAPISAAIPPDGEVVTTASGLKYSVIKAGAGTTSPKQGDPVTVSYAGWLADGSPFDSSDKHGGPATFRVGGLVEGWNEALKLMHQGDRWKLTIPPKLGYGEGGSPPTIPPGATLTFVLELHDFAAFPTFDPEKTQTLPSGLKYEIVQPGAGDPIPQENSVVMHAAVWTPDGKYITSTREQGGPVKGRRTDLQFPFMRDAVDLLRVGGRAKFDVPPALAVVRGLPRDSRTIWEVELMSTKAPLPIPVFARPEDSKLTTTASGLKYEMIKDGTGTPPTASSTVEVHYHGWLTNGETFDSSYSRGETMQFPLRGVVKGWGEGLQLMKPGAIYKFVIPPTLGYGAQAAGKIPPNSTLVFQVELIRVVK